MDIFSILNGIDNLRKLMVIFGLALITLGTVYPLQKRLELRGKQIALEESNEINCTDVTNLDKEVTKYQRIIDNHSKKLAKLNLKRDSMLQLALDENLKFRIQLVVDEITKLTTKDEQSILDMKNNKLKIQQAQIKTQSLQKEIQNLDWFINWYFWAQVVFIILGVAFLIYGFWGWNKSQKESDRLKDTEIKIKEEELKKLIKDNQS